MPTKISEREWKISLTSILEQLDNSEYKKLCFYLDKISKSAKDDKSREEMPQLIIQHYGVKDSIFSIKDAMERIPRRDSTVQDLLCPFVDKLEVLGTSPANFPAELETEAQTLIKHQRTVCSIADNKMSADRKEKSEGTLVKTRRFYRTEIMKLDGDSPGMQNQKEDGCQQASIYSREKKQMKLYTNNPPDVGMEGVFGLSEILTGDVQMLIKMYSELKEEIDELKKSSQRETDELKTIIRGLKEERDELKDFTRALKEEREQETDELKTIIRGLMEERDELKDTNRGLKEERDELKNIIREKTQSIAEKEEHEITVTKMFDNSLSQRRQLEAKCEYLESRFRRKNLRIHMVPEKCEGNDIDGFMKTLIREKLDVKGEIHIEQAHRVNWQNENDQRSRPMIVRFQTYSMKQRVLKAAWAKKDIRVNDSRIYFNEDFTTKVYRERAQYRAVRKQLKDKNIKSHILFPARLKIFHKNGKIKLFDNPQAAAAGLREFGINMKIPAREPNLESQLQAAGSRLPDASLR